MSDLPDIETYANDYPRGGGVAPHAHDFGQVAFARRGVMRVVARGDGGKVGSGHSGGGQGGGGQGGVWVVPPGRALWIPARVPHEVQCRTDVAMRTVYLRADRRLPYRDALAVLEVTPLLREVILRLVEGPVVEAPVVEAPAGDDTRPYLVALLLAELRAATTVPLHLPQPRDARLERVVARLMEDPAARGTLEDWSAAAGMARRSFARRFAAETGLSFGAWRRRLRMLRAIEQLAAGAQVTAVALETGYDSTSAFIHAFRGELGVTPGRYFGG